MATKSKSYRIARNKAAAKVIKAREIKIGDKKIKLSPQTETKTVWTDENGLRYTSKRRPGLTWNRERHIRVLEGGFIKARLSSPGLTHNEIKLLNAELSKPGYRSSKIKWRISVQGLGGISTEAAAKLDTKQMKFVTGYDYYSPNSVEIKISKEDLEALVEEDERLKKAEQKVKRAKAEAIKRQKAEEARKILRQNERNSNLELADALAVLKKSGLKVVALTDDRRAPSKAKLVSKAERRRTGK